MGRVTRINNQSPTDMIEEIKSPQSDSSAPSGRLHPIVGPCAWVEWEFDECPHCGAAAEILTSAKPGFAFDGDEARCMRCGMPGHICCDSETPASIVWHDEADCDCEWCKNHPPEGCECWPNDQALP